MNTQLWKMYRDWERGKQAVDLFTWDRSEDLHKLARLLDHAFTQWGGDLPYPTAELMWFTYCLNCERQPYDFDDRESFARFIDEWEILAPDDDWQLTERVWMRKDDFRSKAADLPFLSLFLYFLDDDRRFFPLLLPNRHDLFTRRCEAVGVELPPLPSGNHRDCCLYYFDLCEAIRNFMDENGLTPEEACAAIYDFGQVLCDERTGEAGLPEPTNVWLTGAGKGDFALLDDLGNGAMHDNPRQVWACNERTRRGDIVLIYELAPRSRIHSVWRANSSGIFNPFVYYHNRTTVTEGTAIPPVTLSEMKAHPHLSQLPIVRRNMQGVNGVELSAQDYAALIALLKEKGFDTAQLPHLFRAEGYDAPETADEKDVEERLLIPLLAQLGYSDGDYTRQLSQKAGRGLKAIPDFVFFPTGEAHMHNAPLVIEAKHDMRSMRDVENAFRQALSYARMLQSGLMALCDKERLIVYNVTKGQADKDSPLFEHHWAAIATDAAVFQRVKLLIGAETVRNMSIQ